MILYFVSLIFSISIHEAAHAWMAYRCGDDTARLMGRLTLNPLAHIDPIGTILIPIIAMLHLGGIALIGWGKPCPVNPLRFRRWDKDDMLVSLAGPASNIAVAIATSVVLFILVMVHHLAFELPDGVFDLFKALLNVSVVLCFFNLIPIPPLDGSHILRYYLPPAGKDWIDKIRPYGFIILIILINTPLMKYLWVLARVILRLLEMIYRDLPARLLFG